MNYVESAWHVGVHCEEGTCFMTKEQTESQKRVMVPGLVTSDFLSDPMFQGSNPSQRHHRLAAKTLKHGPCYTHPFYINNLPWSCNETTSLRTVYQPRQQIFNLSHVCVGFRTVPLV